MPRGTAYNASLVPVGNQWLCTYRSDGPCDKKIANLCLLNANFMVARTLEPAPYDCEDAKLFWDAARRRVLAFGTFWRTSPTMFVAPIQEDGQGRAFAFAGCRSILWPDGEPQKNWIPFALHDRLHLVKHIWPHTVYELVETKGGFSIVSPIISEWQRPAYLADRELRGNASAVRLQDGRYLAIFHTPEYHVGFYTFEGKPPFRPQTISREFWLTSSTARARPQKSRRPCFFPMSLINLGTDLLITYGENDIVTWVERMSVRDVLSQLEDV